MYCEGDERGAPAEWEGVRLEYVRPRALGGLRTLQVDREGLRRARRGNDVVFLLGYGAALFARSARPVKGALWIHMDGLEWRSSKWVASSVTKGTKLKNKSKYADERAPESHQASKQAAKTTRMDSVMPRRCTSL